MPSPQQVQIAPTQTRTGLATLGNVKPGDDELAIQQRKAEWRPLFALQSPDQQFLFDQMVISSVRVDRCRNEEFNIRMTDCQHAQLSWDDDRRDAAAEIAGKLSKKPVEMSRRLQQTKQGVEWMLARWKDLAAILEKKGQWTEPQTAFAHDLLGTPPELRDTSESIEDPASTTAEQIAYLTRRHEGALSAYDERERNATMRGLAYEPSRALKNLQRYEAACHRTYRWAADQLEPYRRATPPAPTPTPPPPPAPEPEPEFEPQDEPEPQDHPTFSGRMVVPVASTKNRRARRAAAKHARSRCA